LLQEFIFCICTAENSFEVKIETDDDIIEQPADDDKKGSYWCKLCDKWFVRKNNLINHNKIHTEDKLHFCTQCEKCFTRQCYLRRHMIVHSSKYNCAECGKHFLDISRFLRHVQGHANDQQYKCHLCGEVFFQSTHLRNHIRTHAGNKLYKCSLCDRSFSRSSHLQRHTLCMHSSMKSFVCHYCEKQFKTSDKLKLHVRLHTGAKPYSCRHCSDCFTELRQLKVHLLKSHNEGTWFTCHICEKKFCHSSSFRKHSLCHEGVKPCQTESGRNDITDYSSRDKATVELTGQYRFS